MAAVVEANSAEEAKNALRVDFKGILEFWSVDKCSEKFQPNDRYRLSQWMEDRFKRIKTLDKALEEWYNKNQDMQTVKQSIEEAVEGVVEAYVDEQETFSIYNITLGLRDLINSGCVRVDNLLPTQHPVDPEDDTSDVVPTQHLPHGLVRSTFLHLFDSGKLKCDEVSRGKFTTYGPKGVSNSQPNVAADRTKVAVDSVTQATTSAKDFLDKSFDKIKSYLENRDEATLKQIQSRLKTNGITCKDIKEVLDEVDEVIIKAADSVSKYIAKIK